jgi:hypothetical protein
MRLWASREKNKKGRDGLEKKRKKDIEEFGFDF